MPRFLPAEIKRLIVWKRLYLYNRRMPCGAQAICLHLKLLGIQPLPSVSSINRILSRNGLTHGRTGFYPHSDPATPLLPPVGLSW
jgi:putative transposase